MKIVLTGRSGCGKSTLLKMFENSGVTLIPECARRILQEHPGQSKEYRQMKMLYNQWKSEQDAGSFISDRGLHDYIVFSRLADMEIPFYTQQAKHRYNYVFKLPNRPFEHDGVRVEANEHEAQLIQHYIDQSYTDTGHSLIEVPDVSLEDKFSFICDIANIRKKPRY